MFLPLNALSAYDFGRSLLRPEAFASRAKELGYPAVGMADPTVYVYPSLEKGALSSGIAPVFGYRIRFPFTSEKNLDAVLFLKDEKGYDNLCAYLANERRDLPMGERQLAQYHEGWMLVVESLDDAFRLEEGRTALSKFLFPLHRLFGEDFYLGIAVVTPEDVEFSKELEAYARDNGIKTVAFPRIQYLQKKDARSLSLLEAGMRKEKRSEEDLPTGGPYFLLSPAVAEKLYSPSMLKGCEEIASKAKFRLFGHRGKQYQFESDDEILKEKANSGLRKRKGDSVPEEYQKRLDYELSVIASRHFSSYFLLVSDYVQAAKDNGIKVGPGRGSAAGSLVSYALGIVELDPLFYHLSFERFLNPMRSNMPDIDVDFDSERRDEVIAYLRRKYGEDHVTAIGTFSTLKPKSALKWVGPVLSVGENRLSRLLSAVSDYASTFKEAEEDNYSGYRLRKLLKDPYYSLLVEEATPLLGLPVNTSQHAAGVIVNEEPVSLYCPLSDGKSGVTAYEFPDLEAMGYLKCDILALNNLTFLQHLEKRIQGRGEPLPDIEAHRNDPKVYQLLNTLSLSNVFQLDGKGMREAIQMVHPDSFEDLCALIALYRPGPKDYIPSFARRKHGEEKIVYKDKRLEPILKETYGILIYQEQVMETAKAIAGFSLAEADLLRRAISKKKAGLMDAYRQKFLDGATKNGIAPEVASSIYDDIEKFAGYGFNKSHSYSYGMVAFEFLYYKTYYPKDFYALSFLSAPCGSLSFLQLARELSKRGVRIQAPDINLSLESEVRFLDDKAYLPLNAAGRGNEALLQSFLQNRSEKNYEGFFDFLCRNEKELGKNGAETTVQNLIDSGAFDSFSSSRAAMRDSYSQYLGYARFGIDPSLVPKLTEEKEDLGERLYREKKALGLILSFRLSSLGTKPGYETLLLSDDAQWETRHVLTFESETKTYFVHFPRRPELKKNQFAYVKADFGSRYRTLEGESLLPLNGTGNPR